ncbi:MAG: class I SAM-dependent methyltransferase, partial [Candidatus Poribacteria bacterium]
MTDEIKVKKHFEKSIAEFDLLYTEKKSCIRRFIDRRFRYDNYERYNLTLKECENIKGKRVLDIGCGSGRYCIDLAKIGAEKVVGVDFADTAIKMACSLADDNNVSESCSFILGDFMDCSFDQPFDVSLAIGVMDYVSDPVPLISKMCQVTTEKLIMSFPSKSTYRMAI